MQSLHIHHLVQSLQQPHEVRVHIYADNKLREGEPPTYGYNVNKWQSRDNIK